MSKPLALFFAFTAAIWMIATAVALSHNGGLAALFAILTVGTIGGGFVVKARLARRNGRAADER